MKVWLRKADIEKLKMSATTIIEHNVVLLPKF